MSAKIGIPFYSKYGRETPKVTAKWAEYLAKFGMGVKTGSGLPGEFAGSNDFIKNAQKDSYQSAMVYASWGQNEKTTTLAACSIYSYFGQSRETYEAPFCR